MGRIKELKREKGKRKRNPVVYLVCEGEKQKFAILNVFGQEDAI